MGTTHIKEYEFIQYLEVLDKTNFKKGSYILLEHNCINFSNILSNFLLNRNIPKVNLLFFKISFNIYVFIF